jgi:iron(III) transport system permease protein
VPLGIALPAGIVSVFVILPLVYLLLRAANAGPQVADLASSRTIEILLRSIWLTIAVSLVAMGLGVPLAWLTVRSNLPFRRGWLVLATLPLVIPTYVSGLAYILALGPRGALQGLLAPFGVERLPDLYGFPGALLILGFHTYPYVMLTVRAALERLDPSLEEASRSLGHGSWDTFRHIVLPQLRPSIAAGTLLAGLYALGDFGAVSLMNYQAFTWAIYLQYQSAFNRNAAALLSLVLVGIAMGVVMAETFTRKRAAYFRANPGAARRAGLVQLGEVQKAVSLLFCGLVVALAVALPLAILAVWAIQGLLHGQGGPLFMRAAMNSLAVAAVAAVLTTVAALPIAILAVRYPGRLASSFENVAYVGYALPRIAVALGLVFFGANYFLPLYQTTTLLLLAYVIVFLPTALAGLTTSLRQVTPHLEEAARSLGRGRMEVFLRVTLPIILPGVLAGVALVFLLTMEELPATLLLRPPGMETLATAVWSTASEALFTQASISSLFLVAVSSLSLALMFRQRDGAVT